MHTHKNIAMQIFRLFSIEPVFVCVARCIIDDAFFSRFLRPPVFNVPLTKLRMKNPIKMNPAAHKHVVASLSLALTAFERFFLHSFAVDFRFDTNSQGKLIHIHTPKNFHIFRFYFIFKSYVCSTTVGFCIRRHVAFLFRFSLLRPRQTHFECFFIILT